ncbi:hypothetical protein BGZ94_001843 [Podila epigama]|nr:hypothetical protein BGZ94_001843 [Podila epigama]
MTLLVVTAHSARSQWPAPIRLCMFWITAKSQSVADLTSIVATESNTSAFARQLEQGLSSSTFDLRENVLNHDHRQGLENTDEILELMQDHGCDFDQARLLRQQRQLAAHNIDPQTGLSLDPKAVSFSSSEYE